MNIFNKILITFEEYLKAGNPYLKMRSELGPYFHYRCVPRLGRAVFYDRGAPAQGGFTG